MLENKIGMIFGVANKRSIAWACALACGEHGAQMAFTYQGERLKENVEILGGTLDDSLVVPCDVTNQSEVDAAFDAIGEIRHALISWSIPSRLLRKKPSKANLLPLHAKRSTPPSRSARFR